MDKNQGMANGKKYLKLTSYWVIISLIESYADKHMPRYSSLSEKKKKEKDANLSGCELCSSTWFFL